MLQLWSGNGDLAVMDTEGGGLRVQVDDQMGGAVAYIDAASKRVLVEWLEAEKTERKIRLEEHAVRLQDRSERRERSRC